MRSLSHRKAPLRANLESTPSYSIFFLSIRAIHKIPATAKIASNPGTGGAVVLLSAGCRKLVTPAVVVVAFVVAAVVVAFATAVVVALLVAVTFAVSCAIDGRLKTSINKSAKTLLITTFFILIDHLLYIQQICALYKDITRPPIYLGERSAKQIREQLIKTFFDSLFAHDAQLWLCKNKTEPCQSIS